MIPIELIMQALQPGPQAPGGMPASAPKGRFPSEIAGKKYDPQTGNLIREPGPMDQSLPRPAPARVTEIGGDPAGRPSPPSTFDQEFAGKAPEEMKPPPMKGYRISFGGQTFDIDPGMVAQRQRDRIRSAFDPLDAGNAQQKAAAQQARAAAEKYIGILPPKLAVKFGMDVYQQEMDRDAAYERAKFGGSRGPVVMGGYNKDDVLRQGSVFDDFEQYTKNIQQSHSLIAARNHVDGALKIQEMLKSNNSMADWAAQKQFLKEFLKGAVSDYDSKDFRASGGKIAALQQEINNWVDGGAAPADIKRKLADVSLSIESYYRKKLEREAQRAREDFELAPGFTERLSPAEMARYADILQSRIAGRRIRTAPPAQTGAGGGKPAAPGGKPAPAAGGDDKKKRADDVLRRLRR